MIPGRAGQSRFKLLIVLVPLLLAGGLRGCAATSTPRVDRTGGVAFCLIMIDSKGGSAARYEVQPDGTLGFSGGLDAHFNRVTWTGVMTDAEIARLLELIETYQWFDRSPLGSGEPEGLTYRIELSGPSGHKRYRVKGRAESITEVESFLDPIARRRFDPIMEALPKPGERN